MGRPRTPIGTFGDITYVKVSGARVRARTRYRDDDGQVRRVSATGATNKEAERNLKKVLSQRPSHVASGELTGDTSFGKLVEVWLEDLGEAPPLSALASIVVAGRTGVRRWRKFRVG